MLTRVQQKVISARRPRGLGYSTRLTISQATPTIATTVSAKGSSSRTSETTVIAPKGLGMPWKTPSRNVVQEKRASRSTTASTSSTAADAATLPWASSETMPHTTTKYAGASPKLIRSERLSSSAPIAELRSLRATSPSKRSKTDASSISVTAPAALCLDIAPSLVPIRCGTSTPVVVKYTAMNPQIALPRVRPSAMDSRVDSGSSATPSSSSLTQEDAEAAVAPPGADADCVSGSRMVKASHPSRGGLPDLDRGLDARRQIDVDARAEPDQPDPLALLDLAAPWHVRHDPPRHRAGDLHHLDVTEFGVEVPDHPLVVFALLVERRYVSAGDVLDGGDRTGQGSAVDVHVQRAHENRDPDASVLPRHDALHHAVGRGDHAALGDLPLGVAEEPQHAGREGGGRYGQGRPATGPAGLGETDRRGGHSG